MVLIVKSILLKIFLNGKKICVRFYWNCFSNVRKGNVYVLCLKYIFENNGFENGCNIYGK